MWRQNLEYRFARLWLVQFSWQESLDRENSSGVKYRLEICTFNSARSSVASCTTGYLLCEKPSTTCNSKFLKRLGFPSLSYGDVEPCWGCYSVIYSKLAGCCRCLTELPVTLMTRSKLSSCRIEVPHDSSVAKPITKLKASRPSLFPSLTSSTVPSPSLLIGASKLDAVPRVPRPVLST